MTVTDPVLTLEHLFRSSGVALCRDAADAQDGGSVDIADAVYVLLHLFLGGPPPFAPYPQCGVDVTADGLRCAVPPPECAP